jgi:hypothetical protein
MNIRSNNSKAALWEILGANKATKPIGTATTRSAKENSPSYQVSKSDTSKLFSSWDWLTEENKAMIGKMLDFTEKNGMDKKPIEALAVKPKCLP